MKNDVCFLKTVVHRPSNPGKKTIGFVVTQTFNECPDRNIKRVEATKPCRKCDGKIIIIKRHGKILERQCKCSIAESLKKYK